MLVPMIGGKVASSPSANHRGLWAGSPVPPQKPVGSLAWGASPWGVLGSGGHAGASADCGAGSWHPHPPQCFGRGCSLLSLVPFPVHRSGDRCWEANSEQLGAALKRGLCTSTSLSQTSLPWPCLWHPLLGDEKIRKGPDEASLTQD